MEGSEHRSPRGLGPESVVDLSGFRVPEDAAQGRLRPESAGFPPALATPPPQPSSAIKFLRPVLVAAILACSVFSLPAQTIKEVRVGAHPDFVRVVFESDAPLKATTSTPQPGVIEAQFSGAAASTPVLFDPGKQLKSFNFRPQGSSLIVSLEPGLEEFSVRRYRITRPHRVVLDISPEEPAEGGVIVPVDVSGSDTVDFAWVAGALMLAALSLSGGALLYKRSKRRQSGVAKPKLDSDSGCRRKITDLDQRIQQQIAAYQRLVERRDEL